MRIFRDFPIGHNFEVTFKDGRTVRAVKVNPRTFAYCSRGVMRIALMTKHKIVDDFSVSRQYAVHTCIYNPSKVYIIKRENFNEVILFQMVLGQQVGKIKFTDDQLLATFEGIDKSAVISLNVALQTKISKRLYKLKLISNDWRKVEKTIYLQKR